MYEEQRDKKETILVIFMVVAIVFLYLVFLNAWSKQRNSNEDVVIRHEDPFENIDLEAQSAFVWDVKKQKVLYGKNEESQLPLASLTKLMTALVVSELVPRGTIITIKDVDIMEEGDSGFSVGEKWVLSDVLDFTLMTSSNDGAHALASVIGFVRPREEDKTEREMFIGEMNNKADELGLTQTFFLSESGLDISKGFSGAYGSARDIALLMDNIIENNPELLEATKYSSLEIWSKDSAHIAENTNYNVESTPGIIGSKTGFTDLAGGNLIVAFDVGIGHPIVVSVLGSGIEGRFEDVDKLVNAAIEKIAQN